MLLGVSEIQADYDKRIETRCNRALQFEFRRLVFSCYYIVHILGSEN